MSTTRKLAKSMLNLDWVEQHDTPYRTWLCVSDAALSVVQDNRAISGHAGSNSHVGFDTVYAAMKWCEAVWITKNS